MRQHIESGAKGHEAMGGLTTHDQERLTERARLVEEQMQLDPDGKTADDRLMEKIQKEMQRG